MKLLDAKAVAERIGCTPQYVRRLWQSKMLPCVTLPSLSTRRKTRRIDADVLAAWISEHTEAVS